MIVDLALYMSDLTMQVCYIVENFLLFRALWPLENDQIVI